LIAHFRSLLQRGRPWAQPGLVPRERGHLEGPTERWKVTLYTIVIAETLAMLGFMLSLPFLPFYIQQLGVTDLQQITFWVAVLNSVPTLTMAVAAPFWGVLADRRGRKPMLIRAMLGGSLVLSAMGFVTSVVQLTGLRVIEGTLTGTVTAATTLVASNVPRERTGYALGLLQAGIFVGSWLGPSLGGLIAGTFGYRVAFLTSGCMLLAAAVLTFFLVSEHFIPVRSRQRVGRSLSTSLREVRSDQVLLSMVLLLLMTNVVSYTSSPIFPLFVQTLVPDVNAAATMTGLILGLTAAMNTVGALAFGRLGHRWSARRILWLSLAVTALTFLPQGLAGRAWQLLVMRGLMGLAIGAVVPVANAAIAENCPEGHQGGVFGISTSFNALGSAVGPWIGTFVVAAWNLPAVFPVTGVMVALMALGVVVWVPAHHPVDSAPRLKPLAAHDGKQ